MYLRCRDNSRRLVKTHILVLDVAGFTNALPECRQIARTIGRRRTVEEPDHRHRRLLRPRAASGHVAAPPSSVMNSRRPSCLICTRSPRSRGSIAAAYLIASDQSAGANGAHGPLMNDVCH